MTVNSQKPRFGESTRSHRLAVTAQFGANEEMAAHARQVSADGRDRESAFWLGAAQQRVPRVFDHDWFAANARLATRTWLIGNVAYLPNRPS